MIPLHEYHWFGADGEPLMTLTPQRPASSGWEPDYLFFQPELEEALDGQACTNDRVAVYRGWVAEGLVDEADGAALTLRRHEENEPGQLTPTDETRTVRARWVIGADGANSFVRESVGIVRRDLGFQERWLVVDAEPTRHGRPGGPAHGVPVVRSATPDDARPQWAAPPPVGVHAPARRESGGFRRPRAGLVAARAVVPAGRRPSHPHRGLRVSLDARGADARGARPARRRRRPPDAAVPRPGAVLRPARRGEPRLEAGPRPARSGAGRAPGYGRNRAPAADRVGDPVRDRAREGPLRAGPQGRRRARRGRARRGRSAPAA